MGEHKADRLLRWALFLFAGSCILSITLAEAALALMLAAILWKAFTSPEGFTQPAAELHANPLVFPLAVYLAVYIFSSVFSLDPRLSFSRLDTEAIKALSAALVFSAVSRAGRQRAADWFLAGASGAGALGIWQFLSALRHPIERELPRAYGTMHAVSYAEVMAIAAVLAAALAGAAAGRARRLYTAAFFLTILGFCASLSRGPALGLLIAFAALFYAQKNSRRLVLAGLAVVTLAFGASAVFNKTNRARLLSVTGYVSAEQPAAKLDYSANVRVTMWQAGTEIFKDYPLTGTGPYSLRRVFAQYHGRPVDGVINFTDVHNLYLQRAADMGVPGLLAMLMLFWAIARSSFRSFLAHRDAVSLWGAAAFAGFLVMMATDSSFDLPRTAFCVYLLAALAGPAGRAGAR